MEVTIMKQDLHPRQSAWKNAIKKRGTAGCPYKRFAVHQKDVERIKSPKP
jgi:hypothetical protein